MSQQASAINELISQFKLQEKLFNNVTFDIKDEDARKKINNNTNNLTWLIGHTVSTRYMLLNVLGEKASEPFPDLYGGGKGWQASATYPNVKDLLKDWSGVSQKLYNKLSSMSQDQFEAKAPQPTPMGGNVRNFVSFCAHHEAYTIGQMGLYRRVHGYPAMKYM